jgi:hypothetical protein
MKRLLNGQEIEMTEEEIQALEQSRLQAWDLNNFIKELSLAFDIKFETYWKEKGYENLTDLVSHEANPNSPHYTEALSLIQWAHEQWEVAITNINENSNIEKIINSLAPYQNG